MSAIPDGELTSGSLLIQFLRVFGCANRRRANIREFAYSVSERF